MERVRLIEEKCSALAATVLFFGVHFGQQKGGIAPGRRDSDILGHDPNYIFQ